MQNRRDFLKMGIVGSAFLPTFANLTAKAEQKDSVGQGKARKINIGIVGFGTMGKILSGYLARCEGVRVRCVCDIWKFQVKQAEHVFKAYKQEINTYLDFQEMLAAEAKNIEAIVHHAKTLTVFPAFLSSICRTGSLLLRRITLRRPPREQDLVLRSSTGYGRFSICQIMAFGPK